MEVRAIERLGRWILLLAVLGGVAAEWRGGWRWSLGFLLGAAASYWNFRAIKKIVDRLAPGTKPPGRGIMRVLLRFLALALGAFAILRYSEISVRAALIGLFVSAAAVILEIVFELVSPKSL
ncbi:MAG: ATP synthase subunit I [Acidobacteriota bacterium]|nr:ATP synthase subunit I [Acidobacteriota bacterium]